VCQWCGIGAEQFCETGQMLGLDRQGGYAEAITLPARNAHPIPDQVSSPAAAVMMCSTATSLHALRKGRVGPGTTVGIFGAGGLGMSAIQLAIALGAERVLAVDINPAKLEVAESLGAVPVDGSSDPVGAVLRAAPGGIDVGLELVGAAELMESIVATLAPGGRAVAVGITHTEFGLDPYRDLIRREAEIIGAADHLSSELDELLAMAAAGTIDVDRLITRQIPLDLEEVEAALQRLEAFGDDVRTVIVPD
jgi:propanol-preferring alcohol dehydrogenase